MFVAFDPELITYHSWVVPTIMVWSFHKLSKEFMGHEDASTYHDI